MLQVVEGLVVVWEDREALCIECDRVWVSVSPVELNVLQCPSCRRMTGRKIGMAN